VKLMTRKPPYRVIQWATGAMGKTCLRAVIDHPDLELVGLYVHSERKAGLDAGDIAKRAQTGVIATRSLDDILALDADVVLHCPLLQFPYDSHDDSVCRLLEAGFNVISINNYFHPASISSTYAERLQTSAQRGGASLAGTGINPGFIAERMALAASGVILTLDRIYTREVYDCLLMPNANYVFDVMGMGSSPEALDLRNGALAQTFTAMFSHCVGALAERLGLALERIEADHQTTLAPRDIEARAGLIRQGTVAATNWQVHGICEGRRAITHSINWVMGKSVPGYQDAPHWEIRIDGKPGLTLQMDIVDPVEPGVKTTGVQYGVAAMVVQAIPWVVNAEPGLVHFPASPHFRERLS